MARVLIISEINKDVRRMDLSLAADGHRVTIRTDGMSGFDEMLSRSPDLVIMDLYLSGMTSIELLTLMRKTPKLRAIPVVVLSSRLGQTVDIAMTLDIETVLLRPIEPAEILRTVREIAGRKVSSPLLRPQPEPKQVLVPIGDLLPDEASFCQLWKQGATRWALVHQLAERGWTSQEIFKQARRNDLDLYDAIGYLAYNWPLTARISRAKQARKALTKHPEFVLFSAVLEIYEESGALALESPETMRKLFAADRETFSRIGGLRGYTALLDELDPYLYPNGVPVLG
jgi:CheY-like chemotaxis protein